MRKQHWPKRDPIKNYFPLPNDLFSLGLSAGAARRRICRQTVSMFSTSGVSNSEKKFLRFGGLSVKLGHRSGCVFRNAAGR